MTSKNRTGEHMPLHGCGFPGALEAVATQPSRDDGSARGARGLERQPNAADDEPRCQLRR